MAIEGRKKLLLTATPLQNSLMEIFGLTNFIDPNNFGDANSFRSKYVNAGGDLPELRRRLADFCKLRYESRFWNTSSTPSAARSRNHSALQQANRLFMTGSPGFSRRMTHTPSLHSNGI